MDFLSKTLKARFRKNNETTRNHPKQRISKERKFSLCQREDLGGNVGMDFLSFLEKGMEELKTINNNLHIINPIKLKK